MSKKVGIFLPGRLSSHRLNNKLILPIGDTCLFEIACNTLSKVDDSINKYVLIYDQELIYIASHFPNLKIIIKDKETIERDGELNWVFKDILNVEDDYLMFLNACFAFLKPETIESSIRKFQDSPAEFATSVKPYYNWIIQNDKVLNPINYQRINTKEIENTYEFAHIFHIFNRKIFKEEGYMLQDNFLPIPIDKSETVDVDDYQDYLYAKFLYENKM